MECTNLLTGGRWNSGASAPQWVEIDLGDIYPVSVVNLTCSHLPNFILTKHEISAGANKDMMIVVKSIEEYTGTGGIVKAIFETIDARYIRVTTSHSPSYVAWKKIEVCWLTSLHKSARK